MLGFLTLLATAGLQSATTQNQGDLQVSTFNLPEGRLTVYLPDDIQAGDTISGTVIPTPNGTGRLGESNGATLMGYVVTVQGESPKRKNAMPVWTIPVGASLLRLAVQTSDGKELGECEFPLTPPGILHNAPSFATDPIHMANRPAQIVGPFDGDSSNTAVKTSGQAAPVVAESPRNCVVMPTSPAGSARPGPTTFEVTEGGQSATLPCNIAQIQLAVPKTTLLQGEKTNLTMTVTGLQGLPPDAFPIPVELTNQTPGIVRLESPDAFSQGGSQSLCFGIEPGMVRNGQVMHTIGLVGVQPGAFMLRGVLFAVKIHDVKKAMNAATFKAWVDGLIVSYEATIKKLKEEEAKEPSAGRRLNIARKEKILGVLKAFRNPTNADLDVCKIAVDKALTDDSFFKMAGELIGIAAELLGYTDIPMPGVGAIVKSLKAVAGAAKLVKTLKALEEAEKLIEAYEKLTDAQEKLDQIEKIKNALDNVKEAMEADE